MKTHLCGVRMRNTNKIGENVNGKKLLRVLFTLNGFFCSSRAEIMITGIVGNDYCSDGKCLRVLMYRLFDASAHNVKFTDRGCTSLNACTAFFI